MVFLFLTLLLGTMNIIEMHMDLDELFGGGMISTYTNELKDGEYLIQDVSVPNGDAFMTYTWAMNVDEMAKDNIDVDEAMETMFHSNVGALIDIFENPEKHGYIQCDGCGAIHPKDEDEIADGETAVDLTDILANAGLKVLH